MRQIVLDTETTGLDPAQGHKVIELGCVIELMPFPFKAYDAIAVARSKQPDANQASLVHKS